MFPRRVDLEKALDRWVRDGLLDEPTAERLRADARLRTTSRRRRIVRGLVAGTAAVVLIFAAVLFLRDVWETLGPVLQSTLLGAAGVLLFSGGVLHEDRLRRAGCRLSLPDAPALAGGLQVAGLGVLAVACAHSDAAWPSGPGGGRAVALLCFLTPVAAMAMVAERNRVMPAVVLAGAYVFFGIGIARFTGVGVPDPGIWLLNGIFVFLTGGLVVLVRGRLRHVAESGELQGLRGAAPPGPGEESPSPGGDRCGPERRRLDSLLLALGVHLYVGFPLLFATGLGPLELGDAAFFLLDGWLVVVTAVAVWSVHAAPEVLRRRWMERLLPVSLAIAVPLALATVVAAIDRDATVAAGAVAAVGLTGLAYGLRTAVSGMVELACLALVVAAWIWTASERSALPGAAALASTAALLFWLAWRVGRGGGGEPARPG